MKQKNIIWIYQDLKQYYSFDDKGEFNNTKNVESRIIYQNELSDYMFSKGNNGINENNTNIKVNQLIKTALFLKIIKQIDVKYLNEKIHYYDDFLLFFLLTRNANSYMQINRIFYLKEKIKFSDDLKINLRKRERIKNGFNLSCFAYLTIIEILYDKTKNNFEDKKIAFTQFEKLYLANICKKNINIREKALDICELFLKSQYISTDDKNKKKYLVGIKNENRFQNVPSIAK